MYDEEELVSISLLQHYTFCKRRAALIGIEQHWDENAATIDGEIMHERAHSESAENRRDLKIRMSLRLHSFALGLSGTSDIVEFHRSADSGIVIPGAEGLWVPYPVEYKRGSTHEELPYMIQLCAQSMCLEEMLKTQIDMGAIYWGESRRRQEITFDYCLREQTVETAESVHKFLAEGKTPPPRYDKKCKGCSLYNICMPKAIKRIDANQYFESFFCESDEGACNEKTTKQSLHSHTGILSVQRRRDDSRLRR